MPLRCSLLLFGLFLAAATVRGSVTPNGPKVDEIVQQSDIILKGTVLPVTSGNALDAKGSPLKVISIIKSSGPLDRVNFQHTEYSRDLLFINSWGPKTYHLETGKTYLICAKHTDTPGLYQQLLPDRTATDDTVLLCASDSPLTAKNFPEALCAELIARLPGASDEDALGLIFDLDRLSGGESWQTESVFDRNTVASAMGPLISSPNPKVAQAALRILGSNSSYFSGDDILAWLNARAAIKIINLPVRDPGKKNTCGDLNRAELLAIANGKSEPATRARAIIDLGLLADPAFATPLRQWLTDPSPAVRRAATLLLADFPAMATHEQFKKLTKDPAPEVRQAAALTIGILQQSDKTDLLAKLLIDDEVKVRQAAVASLVTFSPKDPAIAAIFRFNLQRKQFAPIFLNALAIDNPIPYLPALASVIANWSEEEKVWIGEAPHLLAWEIILNYLQSQPPDQLKSGKFNSLLDALAEVHFVADSIDISPTRGFHPRATTGLLEIEHDGHLNNRSVPAIVYAFCLQHDMPDRARNYRLMVIKVFPDYKVELDALFQFVSKNPALF